MKGFIEHLKERIALHTLNSLDKNVRYWLAPGKIYPFRWRRLVHTNRERVVYQAIRLLEAGRFLTNAEQDSLWRLVAQIYCDHDLQLAYGMDRLPVPVWAKVEDEFDVETHRMREKLKQLIPYTHWFQDFLSTYPSV